MNKIKEIISINAGQMKFIAFLTMLIDHFNKAIISPFLTGKGPLIGITYIFDILGRIAFPLFTFMIVEGFFKTKSRIKYLRNLLLCAIVSEIPYDMFQSAELFNIRSQNILWGLALGLFVLIVIDNVKDKINNKIIWFLSSLVVVAIASLVSMLISSDYEYYAIIIIYLMYLFYDKRPIGLILSMLVIIKEIYSFLGFGLILLYNGKKGKQNKLINYLFYPAHLFILGLIRLHYGI